MYQLNEINFCILGLRSWSLTQSKSLRGLLQNYVHFPMKDQKYDCKHNTAVYTYLFLNIL